MATKSTGSLTRRDSKCFNKERFKIFAVGFDKERFKVFDVGFDKERFKVFQQGEIQNNSTRRDSGGRNWIWQGEIQGNLTRRDSR